MAEAPLSFRRWRNSKGATADALACQRPEDLPAVLREPLAYAALQKRRVHYEWVWDGRFVYVVQADRVPESRVGVSPGTLVDTTPVAGRSEPLTVFRRAEGRDAECSNKLRNHFLYADHGFESPPFYIVQDPAVIAEVLTGTAGPDLQADLEILTTRPLVIRTSSGCAAGTLLPRSDLLHSASAAVDWLTGRFSDEVRERQLSPEALTLIAHHFVPAQAAAFSTGSPDDRKVYIEALWGIPEGLYYYPCDAYWVNTRTPSASDLEPKTTDRFLIQKDVRFKGQFVAPDADGTFSYARQSSHGIGRASSTMIRSSGRWRCSHARLLASRGGR